MTKTCLHATTISLSGSGILIRGPSGSGKSSLALQLLESQGSGLGMASIAASLVADDQTELCKRNGKVYASPPLSIAGLLEVRGHGILRLPFERDVAVGLVVDLQPASAIARLPLPTELETELMGVKLPCIAIDPSFNSAASRVRVAWVHLK